MSWTGMGILRDVVTVRPLTTWPGERIVQPRSSPFRAPLSETAGLLDRELGMLGATWVVMELAITEADLRLDGMVRANAIPNHPGVVLSMGDTLHGPLRYATAEFRTWQDNLRAIALALEALRKVDRYGVSKRGEQYRGWRQLTAGGPSVERGRALIAEHGGVARALMATHPDHGGSADDFADVQAAREAGA